MSAMVDCSFDFETREFAAGRMAPRIVCGSYADANQSRLFVGSDALDAFRRLVQGGKRVAFANAAYDLCVAAEADLSLLPHIFRALREGRVHDVLIAEALHAIRGGHLGEMPSHEPLYNPATGKQTDRYSLALAVYLTLGRRDAKENDAWKKSYALLEDVPVNEWPEPARVYPLDDACNTLDVAKAQIEGRPGLHNFQAVPRLPGDKDFHDAEVCTHCDLVWDGKFSRFDELCPKAPRRPPHGNIENLPFQVESDFVLKLNACHSLRTDPERVEKFAVEVEAKHKVYVERFQKKGWIRKDGTECQAAVKRAMARAYGAVALCPRCRGTGKIRRAKRVPCRGEKVRGRYQGCQGAACGCFGTGELEMYGAEVSCKNDWEDDALVERGCDGTGYDLDKIPLLPRTEKLGVKTDRDTAMESGDDDLSDYGENEFEKSLSTYLPYLRTGTVGPLYYSVNVLTATGRCSLQDSPLHQMPRFGLERGCIRARGAWCGSPIEYVLGSTDYEAGELCTLSQLCYWLFGYSQMRDAINASGKPGILHSDLAAEVLGISLEEFLKRLKAKDKQAVDFRQMCKPINFGLPGGMGVPKLVLTSRKKNAGFTVCDGGPSENEKGQPGYWGVRFCILAGTAKACGTEKIMTWGKKSYPCPPVCKACCLVVDSVFKPTYFRKYREIKDYHKWVQQQIDQKRPAPTAIWDAEAQAPRIIRERGCDSFSEFANNGFQSPLSDVGKAAYVAATRECFLGEKDDGSPSSLAGCRLPIYLHDEPLSELIRATAHLSGPRIGVLMEEAGRRMMPDVTWVAKTALAEYWSKSMEPVYDDNGDLTLWVPEEREAA